MSSQRLALLIASGEFSDSKLRPLRAPQHDVVSLAKALGDPRIGAFQVETSLNEDAHIVRRKINRFFHRAEADDFLLLYVSSHGVKDERGHLYFATQDTDLDALQATTCESELIHRLSANCPARQQLMVIDACFSGAFGKAWSPKDAPILGKDDLVGSLSDTYARDISRGLVVFTASTSFQFSFESDSAKDDEPSVFTKHLVEGLATGQADLNGDGTITENELYQYAYSKTRQEQPAQTPQRWVIGAVGEIEVARSLSVKPVPLSSAIQDAMTSSIPGVRIAAIPVLEELIQTLTAARSAEARTALTGLLDDDSLKVRKEAEAALSRLNLTEAAQAPPPAPQPQPQRPTAQAPEPKAPADPPPPASAAQSQVPYPPYAPAAFNVWAQPPKPLEQPPSIWARIAFMPSTAHRWAMHTGLALIFGLLGMLVYLWVWDRPDDPSSRTAIAFSRKPPQTDQETAKILATVDAASSQTTSAGATVEPHPPAQPPAKDKPVTPPEPKPKPKPASSAPTPASLAEASLETKSTRIEPSQTRKLDDLASKLEDLTLEVVIAVGHTDNLGSSTTNQKISVSRAENVKVYLSKRGIPAERIYTEGRGESQPVADNKTAEGRAKNNRVDVEAVGTRKDAASLEKISFAVDVYFH